MVQVPAWGWANPVVATARKARRENTAGAETAKLEKVTVTT
jgi:hypothetical protein